MVDYISELGSNKITSAWLQAATCIVQKVEVIKVFVNNYHSYFPLMVQLIIFDLTDFTDNYVKNFFLYFYVNIYILFQVSLDGGCRQKVLKAGRDSLLSSANPVVHINALNLLSALVKPEAEEINTEVSNLVGNYSMSQVK